MGADSDSFDLCAGRTDGLRTADKVLVLDKGRQAGFASHDALLSTNDLYQSIHLSQHQKGDQDAR